MSVRIQTEDFSPEAPPQWEGRSDIGAVCTFVGRVRGDGDLIALDIEHYPGMAERSIAAMIAAAVERFALIDADVVHRVGHLPVGANIVRVSAAASHRRAAFEGCAFLMDFLKTQAPFWKKECTPGGSRPVAARGEDDAALRRRGIVSNNADGH